jgi:regulation of enolase protein 1 (concanavalin A-like superfamily)
MQPRIPGLPDLSWFPQAGVATYDPDTGVLESTAAAMTDWANDSLGIERQHRACALGFPVSGDFSLSARVRVEGARTTYDAGALAVWADADHWAKLCFELSPAGERMVVSVVTNDWSDDCNSLVLASDEVHYRLSRTGSAFAFHYSHDGEVWQFVRLFRLAAGAGARVGFLSQAPLGDVCVARFDSIRYAEHAPRDLRDGS